MSERLLRTAQLVLIGAALVAGCNREGGPAPEVPALYAGNGGASGGASGVGGSAGTSGEGGQGGEDSGGTGGMLAGGGGGAGGLAGVGGTGGFGGTGDTGGTGGTGGASGTGVPSGDCSDSDALSTELPIDPNAVELSQLLMKGTTVGSNGSFEDSCTDSGDLLEHVCETQFVCNGQAGQSQGSCAPSPALTGVVLEVNTYCFGLCMDGVCHVPCPEVDEQLRVSAVTGASVELEASAGIRFTCTRDLCLAPPPSVDDELTVVASPVPNDTQLDCRQPFGTAFEPLTLSDGCSYIDCTPIQVLDP